VEGIARIILLKVRLALIKKWLSSVAKVELYDACTIEKYEQNPPRAQFQLCFLYIAVCGV